MNRIYLYNPNLRHLCFWDLHDYVGAPPNSERKSQLLGFVGDVRIYHEFERHDDWLDTVRFMSWEEFRAWYHITAEDILRSIT